MKIQMLLVALALSACGMKKEKLPEEPPDIRELNLESKSDGTVDIEEHLPACDINCKLWLVEQPEENLMFCIRKGEKWLVLSSYVGPDETMYCRL